MQKILLLLFLVVTNVQSQDVALHYSNLISPDSIIKNVFILASDSMEGRETGRDGQKKAARFLSSKYQSWKLVPAGNKFVPTSPSPIHDSYKQGFLQTHSISIRHNKEKNLDVNGEKFLFGRDFFYFDYSIDTVFETKNIVFITPGKDRHCKEVFDSPKNKNKNVLIRYEESLTPEDILDSCFFREENLPSSLFVIVSKETISKFMSTGQKRNNKFPLIFITDTIAEKMFFPGEYDKVMSLKGEKPKRKKISFHLSLKIVSNTEQLKGQNVISFIPGTDKEDETIIISGHYDHLGKNDTAIYYGADDNASGTAAVLEMARIFSVAKSEGKGPRRNIVFLNVSGEEKGLLGSAWYVSHPSFPLESTVANLNIDMIGRTDLRYDSLAIRDYVYIIGSDKMSTDLHTINEKCNKSGPGLILDYKYNDSKDPNKYYSRSDHYNFVKKGVPAIFYFDGNHADYHKPSDVAEKIESDILVKRTQLVFLTAWELANREERIEVDKSDDIQR